jgi:hypothetical protein
MNTQAVLKRPNPTPYRRPEVVANILEDDEADKVEKQEQLDQEREEVLATPDDQLSAEEKSFKKRYGDLRSHSQKQAAELKAEINELKKALQEKPLTPSYKPPKTEEEIKAWLTQYPDVGQIVETIAHKRAEAIADELKKELQELRTTAVSSSQARAMAEVRAAHPDFDELTQTDDFHDWAERQSKTVQAMLYDNLDNSQDMIAAIKLYKAEMGIVPKKSKADDNKREAAKAVTPRSTAADPTKSGKKIWKTSEIRKLKPAQFERYEDELDLAYAEGRIEQDE